MSYRFYYASYTAANGGIPSDFAASGPAHAQAYWELANRKEQGNWDHRSGLFLDLLYDA